MGHSSKGGFSYSNLFNLDSLMSFRLPQQGDGFDSNANSSQDESRGNPDLGIASRECGTMKRKRPQIEAEAGSNSSARDDPDSNDEDDGDYSSYISEEHYRSMLGEHLQKYRQGRLKDSSSLDPVASRVGKSASRRNGHSSKSRKYNYEGQRLQFTESKPDYFTDMPVKQSNYYESDFTTDYNGVDRFSSPVLDSSYLDLGEGIHYIIPPAYDRLVSAFNLPSFSDVKVEEYFLKGTLDLGSLATMIASERRFSSAARSGMGDPQPQYDSLQARLRALSASNSVQNFSLQICDIDLDSSCIPEGAAGSIQRSIMSEGGTLQVYFVKVLEKGDTYEIIERRLPKKQIVKKDPSVIEREEMEKMGKMWASIVRKDIPKYQKLFLNMHKKQAFDAKRFAEVCQREVKTKISRSLKWMRGAPARTRKLARDMLVFWKRVDKEQAELRKKEEKEAAEALKREEELREAKRQQQRLNFLLSQTELYSHFMQNKSESQTQDSLSLAEKTVGEEASQDIREEDPEEIELKKEAMKAAQNAVSQQKKITSAFDSECLKLRQASEFGVEGSSDSIPGSSNIDLVHPSTMPVTSSVRTPEMFQGTLKGYQLKGLQWLVNCYEQGLNGILADEMGLGKTVQAITFLAHLAEEKNIWGPFLVVAPSSVLNNWADEISRFCPDLKTLPYWGVLNDRQVLRKNINPKRLYRRESPFHILITSYQLLVADEKYFRRVKWQYLVLDEAQAIKSSQSLRWRTMLTFNCRNRLLLTGTPIQNSMGELWALLHFIMPTLFDSHEQFTEWFSKGIENHAEHGGTLNEHQLSRLHAILKPFMLRRVKKDVMSELTGKTEIILQCELSSRQQAFYQAIKNKISLAELLDGRRGNLSEKKLLNLMNIVVQLRKVCNHPELFERNEGSTYFYFGEIPNSLLPPAGAEGIHYTGAHNPIVYKIPKIVHHMVRCSEIPISVYGNSLCRETFQRLFSIFSPDYIYRRAGTFGFTCLMDLSPGEVSMLARSSVLERLLFSVLRWERQYLEEVLDSFLEMEGNDLASNGLDREKVKAVSRMLLLPSRSSRNAFRTQVATGPESAPYEALVISHQERLISCAKLLKSTYAFIPPVRAPPIDAYCSDRSFAYKWMEDLHHPWVKRLFVGFARTSEFNGPVKPSGPPNHYIQEIDSEFPVKQPLLQLTYKIFGSSPPVRNFDPAKMLTDSGKLKTLDGLLKRLRAENHRVLLFAQMTKMLNILEDYMNFRKYRYLRLDGSSTIADRRDMVRDFQHRNDIFVFLLSTRAGGLGINLTAADTVIFYESDWNPTLDTQAMDRAHRLGQKKEVTVYRLICKETIEEKILQRASQKNTVQQLVMTGRHVQADLLASEDVVSLLIDDSQLEQKLRDAPLHLLKDRQKKKRGTKCVRVDSEGVASLEDLSAPGPENEEFLEKEDKESSSKKKKLLLEKRKRPKLHPSKAMNGADSFFEIEGSTLVDQENGNLQRPMRPKRSKKSRNESDESTPEATIVMPADLSFLSRNNIASMDALGVAEEENADGCMPFS